MSGGAGALLGALQGLNEANSMNLESDVDETGLILGLTAGGVVFGGLIGMLFKKEKTVYKNNAALSIYPSVNSVHGNNFYPMLSFKINLK